MQEHVCVLRDWDAGAHVDRPFKHICTRIVDGWNVFSKRVQLNGLSIVAGYPTPDGTDVPPDTICPNDNCTIIGIFAVSSTDANSPPQGSRSSVFLASDLNEPTNECVRSKVME